MDLISVPLDPNSKLPLYLQLHDHIAAEIASGRISEGERLPGKRTAADRLGISLSTVDGAYQLLASEGYIRARPRSGFVVCRLEQLEAPPMEPLSPAPVPSEAKAPALSFGTGGIDASLFPYRTWARLFKDTLYNRPDLLLHGDPKGDEDLRQAIARYLHSSRGITAPHDRILIGAGMEYLLWLLCHLLEGKRAAVEDPGYPKVHQILSRGGLQVDFIPLDAYGMDPITLRRSSADLVYLTPGHQFPTGLVTPAGRRTELLKWASERPGRYIIEDDYDSEFRFDGRPMPCMQALDPQRVIYIGTFSRTIAPAIRVAYMVLPRSLMTAYDERFRFFSSTVSRFEQQTLCRYMEDGHFGRSLNRMRSRYRARRDLLMAEIERVFGAHAAVEHTHTGLSLLLCPTTDRSEAEIEQRARDLGLAVRGLQSYRSTPVSAPQALVLGYGALKEEDIPKAVELLYTAIFA